MMISDSGLLFGPPCTIRVALLLGFWRWVMLCLKWNLANTGTYIRCWCSGFTSCSLVVDVINSAKFYR